MGQAASMLIASRLCITLCDLLGVESISLLIFCFLYYFDTKTRLPLPIDPSPETTCTMEACDQAQSGNTHNRILTSWNDEGADVLTYALMSAGPGRTTSLCITSGPV